MTDFETAPRGTLCEKDIKIDLLERERGLLMDLLDFTDDDLDRALRAHEEVTELFPGTRESLGRLTSVEKGQSDE